MHRISPPRALTRRACSWVRLSRAAQYGASVQWAEPVTGSSGMPRPGAKNRDTKSTPGSSPGAVTITGASTRISAAMSGLTARTAAADSSTTSQARERSTAVGVQPSAAASAGGQSEATGGRDGKSSV